MDIPKEGIIELDWYKDYGIEIIDSNRKVEHYSDGNKIIHPKFGFISDGHLFDLELEKAKKIATMIEKLRLVEKIDLNSQFKEYRPLIIENDNYPELPEEVIEDWIYDRGISLEPILRNIDNSKKIIYQRRTKWEYKIYDDLPPDYKKIGSSRITLKARFEFIIMDKNIKRIISI